MGSPEGQDYDYTIYGDLPYAPFSEDRWYGYVPDYYRKRYRGGVVGLDVKPEATRVYADGAYAGTAGDFGRNARFLYLPPGRHDFRLELEGYRTHRVRVYVRTDGTVNVRHEMQGGAGETEEVVGEPED